MAMKCTVCAHPNRTEIDKALISGQSNRSVAAQYGLSVTSVRRHHGNHLPGLLVKAQEAKEIAQADSILDEVTALKQRGLSLLDQAEQAGDIRTACTALREMRGILELLAKLSGEIQDKQVINIIQNPVWIQTRTVILEALAPYPQARAAVATALKEVNE